MEASVSAFGEGFPDRYDPYGGYAGYAGDDEEPDPVQRRGPRLIMAAVIGTIALIVVGAIAFAGSLVMSRTSEQGPKSNVAAAASADPSGSPAEESIAPSSGGPTENASASAAPAPTRTTGAPPKQTTPPSRPRTTAAQGGNSAQEAQVLAIVNTERAKAGCQPVAFNAKLRAAAFKHSADMAARNYFAHDSLEGVSFATRIRNEGYDWSNAAENIAKGQSNPQEVMKAWMNSSGHRANILNCKLKDLGVGLAYQGRTPYWTQDFGTHR
jgi:uncharacterized protein YkwD